MALGSSFCATRRISVAVFRSAAHLQAVPQPRQVRHRGAGWVVRLVPNHIVCPGPPHKLAAGRASSSIQPKPPPTFKKHRVSLCALFPSVNSVIRS